MITNAPTRLRLQIEVVGAHRSHGNYDCRKCITRRPLKAPYSSIAILAIGQKKTSGMLLGDEIARYIVIQITRQMALSAWSCARSARLNLPLRRSRVARTTA